MEKSPRSKQLKEKRKDLLLNIFQDVWDDIERANNTITFRDAMNNNEYLTTMVDVFILDHHPELENGSKEEIIKTLMVYKNDEFRDFITYLFEYEQHFTVLKQLICFEEYFGEGGEVDLDLFIEDEDDLIMDNAYQMVHNLKDMGLIHYDSNSDIYRLAVSIIHSAIKKSKKITRKRQ